MTETEAIDEAAAVAAVLVDHAKCMTQYVQIAGRHVRFPSSQPKEGKFIAGNVIKNTNHTKT